MTFSSACCVSCTTKFLWASSAITTFAVLSAFYPVVGSIFIVFFLLVLCCPCLTMCLCKCALGAIDGILNFIMASIAVAASAYVFSVNKKCSFPESGYNIIPCGSVAVCVITALVLALLSVILQILKYACLCINRNSDIDILSTELIE